jgi:hypothetical protein
VALKVETVKKGSLMRCLAGLDSHDAGYGPCGFFSFPLEQAFPVTPPCGETPLVKPMAACRGF